MQLDGMNNLYDDKNVFLVPSRIGKVCIETQNLLCDPDGWYIDDENLFLITLPSSGSNDKFCVSIQTLRFFLFIS